MFLDVHDKLKMAFFQELQLDLIYNLQRDLDTKSDQIHFLSFLGKGLDDDKHRMIVGSGNVMFEFSICFSMIKTLKLDLNWSSRAIK